MHSSSQLQFWMEITTATIEADPFSLDLQMASNSTTVIFNGIINTTSKLSTSIITTIATLEKKSENFELFGDLFRTSLRRHYQPTYGDKKVTSTLRFKYRHCKRLKTSAAQPERTWEKVSLFSVGYT